MTHSFDPLLIDRLFDLFQQSVDDRRKLLQSAHDTFCNSRSLVAEYPAAHEAMPLDCEHPRSLPVQNCEAAPNGKTNQPNT